MRTHMCVVSGSEVKVGWEPRTGSWCLMWGSRMHTHLPLVVSGSILTSQLCLQLTYLHTEMPQCSNPNWWLVVWEGELVTPLKVQRIDIWVLGCSRTNSEIVSSMPVLCTHSVHSSPLEHEAYCEHEELHTCDQVMTYNITIQLGRPRGESKPSPNFRRWQMDMLRATEFVIISDAATGS